MMAVSSLGPVVGPDGMRLLFLATQWVFVALGVVFTAILGSIWWCISAGPGANGSSGAALYRDYTRLQSLGPWWFVHLILSVTRVSDQLPNFVIVAPLRAVDLCMSFVNSHIVFTLAELGIPDLLKDGPKTTQELAELTATAPELLSRVLRAAAWMGLLREQLATDWRSNRSSSAAHHNHRSAKYGLTAISAVLTENHPNSVKSLAISLKMQSSGWPALTEGLRTGKVPFQLMHSGQNLWDYLQKDAKAEAFFNRSMTEGNRLNINGVLVDYPWAKFDRVFDVGGGLGHFLGSLLARHARMRGVLFDQPNVIEAARKHWKEKQPVLQERLEFAAGSFLKDLGVRASSPSDAFVLVNVLHDWDDAKCLEILRNVRTAIGETEATLILVEMAVVNKMQQTLARRCVWDLHMFVMFAGKERNEAQYHELLSASGFQLKGIHATRSLMFVIEATPAPSS